MSSVKGASTEPLYGLLQKARHCVGMSFLFQHDLLVAASSPRTSMSVSRMQEVSEFLDNMPEQLQVLKVSRPKITRTISLAQETKPALTLEHHHRSSQLRTFARNTFSVAGCGCF